MTIPEEPSRNGCGARCLYGKVSLSIFCKQLAYVMTCAVRSVTSVDLVKYSTHGLLTTSNLRPNEYQGCMYPRIRWLPTMQERRH